MKVLLGVLFGSSMAISMGTGAIAATIDAPVPSSLIKNVLGSEWAWASPCDPTTGCLGTYPFDLSFQGPLGWAIPTAPQITTAIDSVGGTASWASLFSDANCAIQYFTNDTFNTGRTDCDITDVQDGFIWNYNGNQEIRMETFVVRTDTPPPPIPLPGAFVLMLGAIGALMGLRRKVS